MHVGRTYPWHEDLWAVSSQWWPGWIPRKVVIEWGTGQAYPWNDFSGRVDLSAVGIVTPDRDFCEWAFPLFGPYTYYRVYCGIGELAPDKWSSYGLVCNQPAFNTPAAAASDHKPDPQTAFGNLAWPTGSIVAPNPNYVAPDVLVRPALWAEV